VTLSLLNAVNVRMSEMHATGTASDPWNFQSR